MDYNSPTSNSWKIFQVVFSFSIEVSYQFYVKLKQMAKINDQVPKETKYRRHTDPNGGYDQT